MVTTMLPPEHSEPFSHKGRQFQAIFFEYGVRTEKNISPGGRTRVIRIQVDDDVAETLSEMDVITRMKNGKSYQIKGQTLSGVGITEIDLALAQQKPFVRRYDLEAPDDSK
jgi:hypothetical protein